jgi:hypothetical protein
VSGPVTVTAPGGFDSLLAVYTSLNGTNFVLVAADDDSYGATNRSGGRLTFAAQAGTTYHVAVDGFGGAAGTFTLSLESPPFPAANLGQAFRWSEDDVRFRILGTPDQMVVLQSSTNLIEWQNVSTNVLAEPEVELSADPRVPDRLRFFRLLSAP